MSLKPFRNIPETIIEWTRWIIEQEIPDPVSDTIDAGSTSFNGTTPLWVPNVEDDTDYSVFIDGCANETFWVTDKAKSGFNVNSSNSSSTALVRWLLIR